MNKLEDLEVERVDGVEKPATGLEFLLMKSDDDEGLESLRLFVSGLLEKMSEYEFDQELADELTQLAKATGKEIQFKVRKAEEKKDDVSKDETPPEPAPKDEREELAGLVRSVLKEVLDEYAIQPKPKGVAKSNQPKAQDSETTPSFGNGMFYNVFYGG